LFIRFGAWLAAWFAFASLFSSLSVAQQTPPPSAPDSSVPTQTQPAAQGQAPPSAQSAPADKDKDKDKAADAAASTDKKAQDRTAKAPPVGTSNDRLGGILPNFLTLETGAKVPPLTVKQKFGVVARSTFDPVQYPWWALLSGLDQAADSDSQLGQGWKGYAKRYGLVAADGTVENFMVAAVLPSLLRQDPRFYQYSEGGFFRRTGYAVTRIVVTRGDSGKAQFNYSEIFGAGLAAAISTYSYHPRSAFISTPTNPHKFVASDRTFRNFASTWGTQVSLDAMTIFLKEFWPDVRRKFSHKKHVETGGTTPAVSKP
jgi:hypothetical protein